MKSSKQERIWKSIAASGIKLLSPAADHMSVHTLNAILTQLEFRERAVIWDRLTTLQWVLNRKMTQWCFIMNTLRRSDWFTHISSPLFSISLNVIMDMNVCSSCPPSLLVPPHPLSNQTTSSRRENDVISRCSVTNQCKFPTRQN